MADVAQPLRCHLVTSSTGESPSPSPRSKRRYSFVDNGSEADAIQRPVDADKTLVVDDEDQDAFAACDTTTVSAAEDKGREKRVEEDGGKGSSRPESRFDEGFVADDPFGDEETTVDSSKPPRPPPSHPAPASVLPTPNAFASVFQSFPTLKPEAARQSGVVPVISGPATVDDPFRHHRRPKPIVKAKDVPPSLPFPKLEGEVYDAVADGTDSDCGSVSTVSSFGCGDSGVSDFSSSASCHEEQPGKLFVGSLAASVTEQDLYKYFSQFGDVKSCFIKFDLGTNKSRGFGFVVFRDADVINTVMGYKGLSESNPDGLPQSRAHVIHGRPIHVRKAKPIAEMKRIRLKDDFDEAQHKRVFIGGVPLEVTEEVIQTHFSKVGPVEKVILIFGTSENDNGRHRGIGFVTFAQRQHAESAIRIRYHAIPEHFCTIECKPAIQKGDKSHQDSSNVNLTLADFQTEIAATQLQQQQEFVKAGLLPTPIHKTPVAAAAAAAYRRATVQAPSIEVAPVPCAAGWNCAAPQQDLRPASALSVESGYSGSCGGSVRSTSPADLDSVGTAAAATQLQGRTGGCHPARVVAAEKTDRWRSAGNWQQQVSSRSQWRGPQADHCTSERPLMSGPRGGASRADAWGREMSADAIETLARAAQNMRLDGGWGGDEIPHFIQRQVAWPNCSSSARHPALDGGLGLNPYGTNLTFTQPEDVERVLANQFPQRAFADAGKRWRGWYGIGGGACLDLGAGGFSSTGASNAAAKYEWNHWHRGGDEGVEAETEVGDGAAQDADEIKSFKDLPFVPFRRLTFLRGINEDDCSNGFDVYVA